MSYAVAVFASGYQLAEGPTVDTDGTLLFSDVLGGGVHRLHGDGRVDTVIPKRRGVGGITLHADGGIVCSGRTLILTAPDGATREVTPNPEGAAGWNDITADAEGDLWAGEVRFFVFDPVAEEIPGEIWRIGGGTAVPTVPGVVHPNGIAFSPDGTTVYVSDTRRRLVLAIDRTQGMSTRVFDMSEHGHPDGMAVDENGAIWLALVGGGLRRFTPNGVLDQKIETPSKFVASCCFAGRDLYITTGGADGGILRTTVAVAGTPVHPARV